MNKEQINYVVQQLQSGVDELTISHNLREAGYFDRDVTDLITTAKSQMTPTNHKKSARLYVVIGVSLAVLIILLASLFSFMGINFSSNSSSQINPEVDTSSARENGVVTFEQFNKHDQLTFEIPADWHTEEQLDGGASQINFINPENNNEVISITSFMDMPQSMNSPVALDLFALSRSTLFKEEAKQLSSNITEVSGTQARYSSFSRGGDFNTVRVVHFVRNGVYHELLASLNSGPGDDLFDQVVSSINFKTPIETENNHTQNDALYQSNNIELFTLINKINFFVNEMANEENIPSLVCALVENPSSGLRELSGINSSCTAGNQSFAISFNTISGYYCIDSNRTHSYWGNELLASSEGTCLNP